MTASGDPDVRRGPGAVATTVAGTAVALVGAAIDPSLAALLGVAGAAVSPAAATYGEIAARALRDKGAIMWAAFSRRSGLSAADLLEKLVADPALVPLIERIRDAVRLTNSEPKLRAIGALLGEALSAERPPLDDTMFLMDALADLEAPQVAMLTLIGSKLPMTDGWATHHIVEAHVVTDALVPACLGSLVRRGLVVGTGSIIGGGTFYNISQLGNQMLEYMTEVRRDTADDSTSAED